MSRPRIFGRVRTAAEMIQDLSVVFFNHDSTFLHTGYRNSLGLLPIFTSGFVPFAGAASSSAFGSANFSFVTKMGDSRTYWNANYPNDVTSVKRINPITQKALDDDSAAAQTLGPVTKQTEVGLYKFKNQNTGNVSNGGAVKTGDFHMFDSFLLRPNISYRGTEIGAGEDWLIRPLIAFPTIANGGDRITGLRRMYYFADTQYDFNGAYTAPAFTINDILAGTAGANALVDYHADCDNPSSGNDLTKILTAPNPIVNNGPSFFYSLVPNVAPGQVFYANLLRVLYLRIGQTVGTVWVDDGASGRRIRDHTLDSVQSLANGIRERQAMCYNGMQSHAFLDNYTNEFVYNSQDVNQPNPPALTLATYKTFVNDYIDKKKAEGHKSVILHTPQPSPTGTTTNPTIYQVADMLLEVAKSRPDEVLFVNGTDYYPGKEVIKPAVLYAGDSGQNETFFADNEHPGSVGGQIKAWTLAGRIAEANDAWTTATISIPTQNVSSGSLQASNWANDKSVITIQGGCAGITVKVPSSETSGVYANIDSLHEDTETGFPIRAGQEKEFVMATDNIFKVTLTSMTPGATPIVDFGVTRRMKSES